MRIHNNHRFAGDENQDQVTGRPESVDLEYAPFIDVVDQNLSGGCVVGLDQLRAPAPEQKRVWIKLPTNRLLSGVCLWLVSCSIWRMMLWMEARPQNVFEKAGNLILGQFHSYFAGAIGSGFPVIWGMAVLAGAAFLLTVTMPSLQSRQVAKFSISVVLVLSLFTLWAENYLTFWGRVVSAAMTAAKFSLLIPNVAVTVAWLYCWRRVFQLVDQELPAPAMVSGAAILPKQATVSTGTTKSTMFPFGMPKSIFGATSLLWFSLPPHTGRWLLVYASSFAMVGFFATVLALVLRTGGVIPISVYGVHPLLVAAVMYRLEPVEVRSRRRAAGWLGVTFGLTVIATIGVGVVLTILNG